MATNDRDVDFGNIHLLVLSNKLIGTDNIQSGDTKELSAIIGSSLLEDFSSNRDCRVDGVGNDQHSSLGAGLGRCLDNIICISIMNYEGVQIDTIQQHRIVE
jgi:hypothetical protein